MAPSNDEAESVESLLLTEILSKQRAFDGKWDEAIGLLHELKVGIIEMESRSAQRHQNVDLRLGAHELHDDERIAQLEVELHRVEKAASTVSPKVYATMATLVGTVSGLITAIVKAI